jgi:hypothetical protein
MNFFELSTHDGFRLVLGLPFAVVLIVLLGFVFKRGDLIPAILAAVRFFHPGEHGANSGTPGGAVQTRAVERAAKIAPVHAEQSGNGNASVEVQGCSRQLPPDKRPAA